MKLFFVTERTAGAQQILFNTIQSGDNRAAMVRQRKSNADSLDLDEGPLLRYFKRRKLVE